MADLSSSCCSHACERPGLAAAVFQAVGAEVKERIEALGGTFFVITVARMVFVALLLSMLKVPVLAAAQIATTASSDDGTCFQVALLSREEPWSHTSRSERLRCCHEAAPKSLMFHDSTPQAARRHHAHADGGQALLRASWQQPC